MSCAWYYAGGSDIHSHLEFSPFRPFQRRQEMGQSTIITPSSVRGFDPYTHTSLQITNGVYSDWFTCAVRTQGKAGDAHGITILLIPKTDGVKCSRMLMSGQWCAGEPLRLFASFSALR